ncbi:MAG: YihY/virulence factor BrkB family protein [Firmicutes bacterium]|nr:YihY/virulence factor BrkB family protein [Bacillota bacterium]
MKPKRSSRLLRIVGSVVEQMTKPYYQGVAAELGFFLLLSAVPMLILVAQALGFFSLSLDSLTLVLDRYLSEGLRDAVSQYLAFDPTSSFSIGFLIAALWAASKIMFSLIGITNYTYTGSNAGRGFIWERLRAILLMILLILFLLAVAALFALRLPLVNMLVYPAGILLLYYILPSRKLPWRSILPGSLLTGAGGILVTVGYGFYLNHFADYSMLYGSLAGLVGLLLWLYLMGFVMVLGIVFNAALLEEK